MRIVLASLQAFIALGAIGGGFIFIRDPSGATMGLPVSLLEGSIFRDYLVPGLFLFVVNGLGSLAGAILTFARDRRAGPVAIALGLILMAWIVIQVAIIRSFHWLQVLYFALGLVEALLGIRLTRRRDTDVRDGESPMYGEQTLKESRHERP